MASNRLDEALQEAFLTPYEEPLTPTWERLMESLAKRDLIVVPRGMFRDALRWMYWFTEPTLEKKAEWMAKASELLGMGGPDDCPFDCPHVAALHNPDGSCPGGCHD